MARRLRFGAMIPQTLAWQALVDRWQQAENLGFDSVWLADHFANPSDATKPWLEAWTLLAGLATQTTRVRIGAMVSPITFHNPALLAKKALTVDHISKGRLELGLGAGNSALDHRMTGIDFWTMPERMARFREAVEIVDRMLRNEATTYDGKYYKITNAAMSPRPVQLPRPPITIAAHGPVSLRVVARYADSWNSVPPRDQTMAAAIDVTRSRNAQLDDYCLQAGRDPQNIKRSLMVSPAPDLPLDSVDAICEFVERYVEAGINEFILPFRDSAPAVENFAGNAMARLRTKGE